MGWITGLVLYVFLLCLAYLFVRGARLLEERIESAIATNCASVPAAGDSNLPYHDIDADSRCSSG
jgi:hypothetical protein